MFHGNFGGAAQIIRRLSASYRDLIPALIGRRSGLRCAACYRRDDEIYGEPNVPCAADCTGRHVGRRENILEQAFSGEWAAGDLVRRPDRRAARRATCRRWAQRDQRRRGVDGWPDSATYAQREADYLSAEIAALDEVLSELEQDPARELVLDTTGSVIYTGNNILMRLRRQMTVVYLAASQQEQDSADRAVFDRSEAGAVARGVSAEEWRDAARDRGAVLSEAGRGAAAEL